MMEDYKNISIVLKFKGENILAQDIVHSFDDLEAALYKNDKIFIENVSREIELKSLAKDAALERVRKYRGKRIKLQHVKEGSFIFEFLVTGVGLWVLEKTLGETIAEGYKNSYIHNKLSEAITTNINKMAYEIIHTLQSSNRKISHSKIELKEDSKTKKSTIYITIEKNKEADDILNIPRIIKSLDKLSKKS